MTAKTNYAILVIGDLRIPVMLDARWLAFDRHPTQNAYIAYVFTERPSKDRKSKMWIGAGSKRITAAGVFIDPPEPGRWDRQLYELVETEEASVR